MVTTTTTKVKLLGISRDPKKSSGAFFAEGSYMSISRRVWNPNTDIYETASEVILKLEVAGVGRDDIEIIAQENRLHIKGVRKDNSPDDKERYHQMQIDYGGFEKAFIFPFPIHPEKIKAVVTDGFLEVSIPKAKKKTKEEISIRIES